jgi:hypothetical protein
VTLDNSLVEIDVDSGKRTWAQHIEPGLNRIPPWFSTDGQYYLTEADHTLWRRDGTGRPSPAEKQLNPWTRLVSCSPDPRYACCGNRLLDLRSGQEWGFRSPFVQPEVAVSADLHYVAFGARGTIQIVTLSEGGR